MAKRKRSKAKQEHEAALESLVFGGLVDETPTTSESIQDANEEGKL